jgi:hypothetical protein
MTEHRSKQYLCSITSAAPSRRRGSVSLRIGERFQDQIPREIGA